MVSDMPARIKVKNPIVDLDGDEMVCAMNVEWSPAGMGKHNELIWHM